MSKREIVIAIAGNPNSGKTTIFNELTGSHHKVGNYPGVTVEKRFGWKKYKDYNFKLYDLPGTYSLTSYSLDELVARDFIINEKPDVVINVMDSTNLERHLYLCLQIQEFGIPVVGALNMADEAEAGGINIDDKELSEILGIPMVKTIGRRGQNLDELLDKVIGIIESGYKSDKSTGYGNEIEPQIEKIANLIEKDADFSSKYPARWLSVKLLEKDKNVVEKLNTNINYNEIVRQAQTSIKWIEEHFNRDCEIVITEQRYGYIHGAYIETVTKKPKNKNSFSESVDKVLLNKFVGLPIFLLIMWGIFQLTFKLGEYPMGWLESLFGMIGDFASAYMPDGYIKSLVVDGIIGGVGGMLTFLPNVLILFTCISLLEDSGYMARTAFLTDKFLHRFGLHGQSFIPFITGFGCSIPAIMGARTLRNDKDRLITILVIPFFSCGARLPVYTLLISAFFPDKMSGNMLFIIYLVGVLIALGSAFLLRKIFVKGKTSPFVMELPPYRTPTVKGIIWHLAEKSWLYAKKAGTLIVAASIVVWFITAFPEYKPDGVKYQKVKNDYVAEYKSDLGAETLPDETLEEIDAKIETQISGEKLENSFAGIMGKAIEPVLKPLGFDWKIGISLITGFAAKEVVVSTLGVLYKVDSDGEDETSLRTALKADPVFNPLVALVLMLFTLIYVPCLATLAIIKQELGKWRWVIFNIVYTTGLAWVIGFVVYQAGRLFFGGQL